MIERIARAMYDSRMKDVTAKYAGQTIAIVGVPVPTPVKEET